MAHPIQPDSYQEINNFYTVTVYNKGAEVIRMIYTLLGKENFRRGMNLYFDRFDGQAVTTEEFVTAMEDASQSDLKQFRRWYKQAGTPEIEVAENYDENTNVYSLKLSQSTPETPGQSEKLPFHIPVKIGLLDKSFRPVVLQQAADKPDGNSIVLNLTEEKQSFEFENINEKPVLSILQGYSAPVKIHFERDDDELAFCMAHETDDFNRWEAGQQLSTRLILSMVESINAGGDLVLPEYYINACQKILLDQKLDKALIARAITLPSLTYVGEMMTVIDVDAIHQAREFIYEKLALELKDDFINVYQDNAQQTFSLSPASMGERFLRNQALSYLMYSGQEGESIALEQYQNAENMTDQMAAFKSLVHFETSSADSVIEKFYQQWQDEHLVMDKWFTVQATIPHISSQARVNQLFSHKDFDLKNPNRVRSLLGAFCAANPICFHDVSGFGYDLLGRHIEIIDAMNPQIASRLSVPLTRWKRFSETRQKLMKEQLQRLISLPDLSSDVSELVEKSLR